jgi:cytochrome P450
MVFRPERYLDTPAQPDPRQFVFGYGHRICPGRHVAENALFVTIAQVLAVFDIGKVVGEDGIDVKLKVEFELGVVSHPVPFYFYQKIDGYGSLQLQALDALLFD